MRVYGWITTNADMSVKNVMYKKKNYIWNPSTFSCENRKIFTKYYIWFSNYVWWKIIEWYDEEIKAIPTNSNEKKGTCKTQNFLIFTVIW